MVFVNRVSDDRLCELAQCVSERSKLIPQIDVNDQGRVSTNVTAIVRITLADGSWHEDVGCGQGENAKGKSAALDKVSLFSQIHAYNL